MFLRIQGCILAKFDWSVCLPAFSFNLIKSVYLSPNVSTFNLVSTIEFKIILLSNGCLQFFLFICFFCLFFNPSFSITFDLFLIFFSVFFSILIFRSFFFDLFLSFFFYLFFPIFLFRNFFSFFSIFFRSFESWLLSGYS